MDQTITAKMDMLDAKIIALFERRMALAEKAAKSMTKRDLRQEAKRIGTAAVEKTTSYACDTNTVAYAEEIVKLMLCAAYKHQRRLLNRRDQIVRNGRTTKM